MLKKYLRNGRDEMLLKCLDTNIILNDAKSIFDLASDGSIIVLSETAVDEIDSKKTGFSDIAYQAREFGRIFASSDKIDMVNIGPLTIAIRKLGDATLWIVSSSHYPDFKDTSSSIINDRKIIHVAYLLAESHDVVLITNDTMCQVRAEALGLNATHYETSCVRDIEFSQTVTLSQEVFDNVHNMLASEVNQNHEVMFYNYKFISQDTGQMKLATVANNIISVIDRAAEDELRRQDIPPLNADHLLLSAAIQNPLVDIVVCEAKAGSGKTVSAISNAIRLVKTKKYEQIVYMRSSVNDEEEVEKIGFLSGNDEKLAVYFHPLHDTLDYIIRDKIKGSRIKADEREDKIAEGIEKLIKDCKIQPLIGLGLRGRTFNDTVFIMDEASNQSPSAFQKTLTRIGKNCKLIIIGSNSQIDNPYVNKHNNGLSYILNACKEQHDGITLHAVQLAKIVRGPITEFAEKLFSKGNK